MLVRGIVATLTGWLVIVLGILVLGGFRLGVAQPALAIAILVGLAAGLGMGVAGIILPLVKPLPSLRMLRLLEKQRPEIADQLSTTYYFDQHPETVEQYGYSPELVRELQRNAQTLPDSLFAQSGLGPLPLRYWQQVGMVWGVLVMLCAGVWWWSGERARVRLAPLFQPSRTVGAPVKILYHPERVVPRGEHVLWHVAGEVVPSTTSRGSLVSVVGTTDTQNLTLFTRWAGSGVWQVVSPTRPGRWQLERVMQDTQFCFVHPIGASAWGVVLPVDPPIIELMGGKVFPPEYTQLPAWSFAGTTQRVPSGSLVQVTATASAVLQDATWSQGFSGIPLTIENQTISGLLHPTRNETIGVTLTDQLGLSNTIKNLLELDIQADQPPVAKLVEPVLGSFLPEDLLVRVVCQLEDDFGLTRVVLNYNLNHDDPISATYTIAPTEVQFMRPTAAQLQQRAGVGREIRTTYEWRHVLDLSSLNLWPGDEVSVWVDVYDNCPHTFQKGTSNKHVLRFPTFREATESVYHAGTDKRDQLTELLERQRDIKTRTQMLQEQLQTPTGDTQQSVQPLQRRLEELQKSQHEVSQELGMTAENLQETVEQMIAEGQTSVRTLEKIERIQTLLDELLTREMRQVLDEFHQMLSELGDELYSPEDSAESAARLNETLEEFEEGLDRTIALLEETLFEARVQRLHHEAGALLEQQKDLLEATRQSEIQATDETASATDTINQNQRLVEWQSRLKQQTEALLDKIEQTINEAPTSAETTQQALASVVQQSDERGTLGLMQQAGELMRAGQQNQSAQVQSQAVESLQQMVADMEQSGVGSSQNQFAMDVQALTRLVDRALDLSQYAHPLDQRLLLVRQQRDWPCPLLHHQVGREIRLQLDEARRIYSEFVALARQNPFVDYNAEYALRMAIENWLDALQSVEDEPAYQSITTNHQALGQLNRGILGLLASLNQTQAAQSSSSSLESWFDALKQMIQSQRNINQKTRQLRQAGAQGQSLLDELKKLANQQRQTRERLEQLNQQYAQYRQLLGDLESVGKDMEQLEQQLEQGRLDDGIEQTQEQILSRLLDADRSMRHQEFSKQRQSQPPQLADTPHTPLDYDQHLEKISETILPHLSDHLRAPVPFIYQDRVRRYFESLLQTPMH